jgi:hypothetical protein
MIKRQASYKCHIGIGVLREAGFQASEKKRRHLRICSALNHGLIQKLGQ